MKKNTLQSLATLKQNQQPISVLTAYDSTFAQLLSDNGIDVILVGDSLGMVMQGRESTVPVSMTDMIYHTQCVAAGNQRAFLVSDLPYMAYASHELTLNNSAKLMQAGANMVKMEGGEWLCQSVEQLTQRGVPVCGHLGLTPQSVDALSGFVVQGRNDVAAEQIVSDAKALESAGAKLLVLECVPQALAKSITEQLSIPTIGIGAGPNTDGQVLVIQDMLGLNSAFRPRFVKNFMADESVSDIAGAINLYNSEVKSRQFPSAEHCFD